MAGQPLAHARLAPPLARSKSVAFRIDERSPLLSLRRAAQISALMSDHCWPNIIDRTLRSARDINGVGLCRHAERRGDSFANAADQSNPPVTFAVSTISWLALVCLTARYN